VSGLVPGDDCRVVAIPAEHERVAPRHGAVDADEQPALPWPRRRGGRGGACHRHSEVLLQQSSPLQLGGGPQLGDERYVVMTTPPIFCPVST
jgi:hypothetical protein